MILNDFLNELKCISCMILYKHLLKEQIKEQAKSLDKSLTKSVKISLFGSIPSEPVDGLSS